MAGRGPGTLGPRAAATPRSAAVEVPRQCRDEALNQRGGLERWSHSTCAVPPSAQWRASVSALRWPGAGLAVAQEAYPTRPIEFIVPWGPGGGADQVARKLGQLLEADLKVSLPVINVPGATGQTGHAKLMSANRRRVQHRGHDGRHVCAPLRAERQDQDVRLHSARYRHPAAVGVLRRRGQPHEDVGGRREDREGAPAQGRRDRLLEPGRPDRQLLRRAWHEALVGAVRQAERALHVDHRRPRRPAVRAGGRRPQLRRRQADSPRDLLLRRQGRRFPGDPDRRRASATT